MTGPQAAAPAPTTWRITGGNPDPEETAAVMAVLTALLARTPGSEPQESPRTGRAGWDRTTADAFGATGTWRQR